MRCVLELLFLRETLFLPADNVRSHDGVQGLHGNFRHGLKCELGVVHVRQKEKEKIKRGRGRF